MATVSCHIQANPDAVFAVLAEGWFYSNWVVGTSHVRAVEDTWPAAGTKLHHASGAWPLVARDETLVEEITPGQRLVLLARGRPFGEARVRIELTPSATGTMVTMHETPVAGPGKWLHNPLTEALLTRRNTESLARFTALVERHTRPLE
ncbi:SRPBCC family protein [Jatrophihabitans lederbergiae]|uniref:SRPBCC family protein n=1 Tax=Jatrophihabitans lederbergiae TaxID=3075547 RepID=A0ABU2JGU8_9ACTN|nr:SRPBCC family protein [Jatrophihabitans sp. DSM 44399]MDT0264226.1 SRPBCC family protein [Jatrophihabitans sp. DSM 44399]